MIPLITLKELADFLLSLPDNEPINMASGYVNDPKGGCLMTKYGKSKGWNFMDCHTIKGWYEGVNLIATIESNAFNLFETRRGISETLDSRITKYYKDRLKEEYKS